MQHRTLILRRHGVFFVMAIVGLVVIISSRLLLVTGVPRQATAEPVSAGGTPAGAQPMAKPAADKASSSVKPAVEQTASH